ncbi:hypothetical protein AAL_08321 [Moelleriella libera RCEF 2490]|uniref:AA1-like domain-containing protein n=1 Tax=Moelleriella libera RCEF 2490 TaxID=1081109 RepID=A0A167VKB8_9HYPO|nr:hypothetical protein AAL_08321 [Moelleriella libera RCEF 2490]
MKLLSLTTVFLLKAVLGQSLEPSGQGNLACRDTIVQEVMAIHDVSFNLANGTESDSKGPKGADIEFRVSIADDQGLTINKTIQCSSKGVNGGYDACSDKNYRFYWTYYETDRDTFIRMYHEPDRLQRLRDWFANEALQGMQVVGTGAVKFQLVGDLYGSKSFKIDCSAMGARLEPDRPCSNSEYTFTLSSVSWPWNHEITITHQDPDKGTLKGRLRFQPSCHGPEGSSDGIFQCNTPDVGTIELVRA